MTSVHNVQLIAGNTSCNWWTTYLAVTNNHSWLLRNLSTLYIIYFPIIRVARMILNFHVDNCICKFSRPRFAMLIYVLANDPLLIFFTKVHSDVIISAIASQIIGVSIVCSAVCSDADQENNNALCHWPLLGEFTGDRWILLTKGQ